MSADLKVSIITVCYNSVDTVEDTIKSVIHQTYPNMEYIVIDGGSKDGTQDIIKRYESNLTCWISEPDRGISDAFNKGLAIATGEIIGILNSDDRYAADAVLLAVDALNANPAAGFVFGDQIYTDGAGRGRYKLIGDAEYARFIRFGMPAIPHPTVFVRREVYQKYGNFDIAWKTSMDYEFFLRITFNGVYGVYIPSVMAYMQLGGESDINRRRAYAETRDISIHYGLNPLVAHALYVFRRLKTSSRKCLEQRGFAKFVRWYRNSFTRRRY